VIEASVSTGMHSFDQYLIELVASEMVTQETALIYAINQHRVEMLMHGYKVQETILKPQWN
jgi:Tfp pilus assembly ATPase PilU